MIEGNITYNIAVEINSQPLEIEEERDTTQLAIIKLNDTFKDVEDFPQLYFKKIPESTGIKCTAFGYGFIGRKLKAPVPSQVKPMSAEYTVELSFDKCKNNMT